MPLFGFQFWDSTLKEYQCLYTAWYKAVGRIYKISPRSHSKFVYEITDDPLMISRSVEDLLNLFTHYLEIKTK